MSANIIKNTTTKSMVEIVSDIRQNVYYDKVFVDGVYCGIVCYDSNEAHDKFVSIVQHVVDNSAKHGFELAMELQETMTIAATQQENNVPATPDVEKVQVKGHDLTIVYDTKAIYNTLMTEEIAHCRDLGELSNAQIKAFLIKITEATLPDAAQEDEEDEK